MWHIDCCRLHLSSHTCVNNRLSLTHSHHIGISQRYSSLADVCPSFVNFSCSHNATLWLRLRHLTFGCILNCFYRYCCCKFPPLSGVALFAMWGICFHLVKCICIHSLRDLSAWGILPHSTQLLLIVGFDVAFRCCCHCKLLFAVRCLICHRVGQFAPFRSIRVHHKWAWRNTTATTTRRRRKTL